MKNKKILTYPHPFNAHSPFLEFEKLSSGIASRRAIALAGLLSPFVPNFANWYS